MSPSAPAPHRTPSRGASCSSHQPLHTHQVLMNNGPSRAPRLLVTCEGALALCIWPPWPSAALALWCLAGMMKSPFRQAGMEALPELRFCSQIPRKGKKRVYEDETETHECRSTLNIVNIFSFYKLLSIKRGRKQKVLENRSYGCKTAFLKRRSLKYHTALQND